MELVGKVVRVEVADSRVFEGTLTCIDCDSNLVLSACTQFRGTGDGQIREMRVGPVFVPGKHVKTVYIKRDCIHEETDLDEGEAT